MPASPKRRASSSAEPDAAELIGRRDAAERAGVHYNTIRLWENAGLLEPHKVTIGRRSEVRYRIEELDAVAASQRDKRGAGPAAGQSLELHADALWGMVQDAGAKATEALEAKARAEALAAQRAEELARSDRRHLAELERLELEQRRKLEQADQRAAAAENRAADLQAALMELAKPAGWALFRRRPIVIMGGQPALPPAPEPDVVAIPLEAEEPDAPS